MSSQGQVIDSLVVRLVGDPKEYTRMLDGASRQVDQFARDANGRLRDMRGRFVADQNAMQAELGQTLSALNKVPRSVSNITGAFSGLKSNLLAIAGVGSVGGLLVKAVNDASNAQESIAKFGSVFAEQTQEATAFVNQLAEDIGRSSAEIRQAMSAYQAFFVGLEFNAEKSFAMSSALERLTLDFAAFHNISDEEAMSRFISAMSGSAEVLDQYGVNIRQAVIEQELMEMGIKKSIHQATEAEKTMARLNVIMEAMGSQGAIGAAARESESFANQVKALKAEIHDLSVNLGTAMLPQATEFVKTLKEMAGGVDSVSSSSSNLGSMFGGVADGVHFVVQGFDALRLSITATIAAALRGMDAIMNPKLPPGMANGPLGGKGGEIALRAGLGPLGFLLPSAEDSGAYADTMTASADAQYEALRKSFLGPTPSERMAGMANGAMPDPAKAEAEIEKFRMDAATNWAELLLTTGRSFADDVMNAGQHFTNQAMWGLQNLTFEIGRLMGPATKADSIGATAGEAVRFGSVEGSLQWNKLQNNQDDKLGRLTKLAEIDQTVQGRIAKAAESTLEKVGETLSTFAIPW